MLGLSRALLTLLIAMVLPHVIGLAGADPVADRAFFVRWVDTGNNKAETSVCGLPRTPWLASTLLGSSSSLRKRRSGRTYLVRRERIYDRRCAYLEGGLTCRGSG